MTFSGFGAGAVGFLSGLADDNSKSYFDKHGHVYERDIRGPLEDLTAEAEAKYGPGRVMRPGRDMRFSTDKSPYRLTAAMWAGEVGGVYLSLGREHIEAGGGVYGPSRDQLQRARSAIAEKPLAAADLREIVTRLEAKSFEMAGPSLKTAPHGFGHDHEQIELLRRTHFAAITHLPVSASGADVRAAWKRVKPLIAWAAEHVGAAMSWP